MFVWTAQLLFESNLPVPEWGAGRFGISAQFDQGRSRFSGDAAQMDLWLRPPRGEGLDGCDS